MSEHQPILIARAKLCEALRSGKYKQCQNTLRGGDKYCFWGLAIEILQTTNPWEKLGITVLGACYFVNMNDRGYDFSQLADCLEAYPIEKVD